ncbi:MAG: DUF721 domain-containing protein [Gammaproteobacteria bacterium]|nr:DUF721 domain-containing protein [Gammaproteobacteria bacterium]
MKSISLLINQKIQQQALLLEKLTRLIHAALPANCKSHTQVAGIRENQLILVTDSPVWAAKLRLYTQNILQVMEEHGQLSINRIQIKQAQPKRIPEPVPVKTRHLQKASANMIKKTADGIDDPALQEALYKLANNSLKDD